MEVFPSQGLSGVTAKVADEDPVDVAGTRRDIVGPASESAMGVDGLDPFRQELALGSVAVGVLALGLQHQHVTRRKTDQEVGTVFPHYAPVDIEDLEAEMVILRPGINLRGVVEHEGVRSFPCAIENAEVDVAAGRGRTWLACEPSAHVARGADRPIPVKDGIESLRVLGADCFPNVLHHLGHVERDDETALQVVEAEQSGSNGDPS